MKNYPAYGQWNTVAPHKDIFFVGGYPRGFLESDHVRGLIFGETFARVLWAVWSEVRTPNTRGAGGVPRPPRDRGVPATPLLAHARLRRRVVGLGPVAHARQQPGVRGRGAARPAPPHAGAMTPARYGRPTHRTETGALRAQAQSPHSPRASRRRRAPPAATQEEPRPPARRAPRRLAGAARIQEALRPGEPRGRGPPEGDRGGRKPRL